MDIINELNKNKGRLLNLLDPYYGVGISSTAGYFVPGDMGNTMVAANTAITANQTRFIQFILPVRAVIGRATINNVAGNAAGRIAGVGLYSLDGVQLCSTTFDLTTAGVKTNTFTAVSLAAGMYYYAWTCNNLNPTFSSITLSTTPYNTILNNTTIHAGTADASSAGAVPSPLGTLAAAGNNIMFCVFEGV